MSVLVSVLISVYNGEKYIKQAVESILNQTEEDWEMVIINDASTDKSPEIILELANHEPRIKFITNEKNLGLTKSLNRGLKECEGEYIARLDADDVSNRERLKIQMDFMENNKEVALCGSQGMYISEDGKKLGEKNLPTHYKDIKDKLLFNNQFIHSSLFLRRAVIDKVGFYNESFKTSQDYELVLRLAKNYPVVNLTERLVSWRVHPGSISWISKKQEWDAIRARWLGITKYNYPKLKGLFNIFLRLGWFIFPQTLKRRHYS
ncbi:glycosyltransferase [Patescibacteria group bacterium]|nr:glycosyltransferase [Patescibacteria group bacterium]MBU1895293.1 glycosyltransferase [Patescibacteria group bacterium]